MMSEVWVQRRARRWIVGAAMISAFALVRVAGAQTPTPCEDPIEPAALAFSLTAMPDNPAVGDGVVFEAQITNLNGGLAGLPAYTLFDSEQLFSIEAIESSAPAVTFVRYMLRAEHAGETVLRVAVNFETSAGCAGSPVFFFTLTTSDDLPISVADTPAPSTPTEAEAPATPTPPPGETASATATLPTETGVVPPTPTATPLPPSSLVPHATAAPNPAQSGQVVTLDASGSSGPILERFWTQRSGPFARLMGCFPTSHGCESPAPVFFLAPDVNVDTTLVFDLLLTASDGSRPATASIEVLVRPAGETPTPGPTATGGSPDATATGTVPPDGSPTAPETGTPISPTALPGSTRTSTPSGDETPPVGGSPTRTAPLPGSPTATGSATRTATPPLPTVTPGGLTCVGDCDNDGRVLVNELVLGVNIALGGEGVDACPSLDQDQSGVISINELIVAVGNALNGCS